MLFRQNSLVEEMQEMKRSFDEVLLRLLHEKTELDCTTITASLRSVSLIDTHLIPLTYTREIIY